MPGSSIEQVLEQVRRGLDRVPLDALAAAVAAGALVVDIRPVENRAAEGEMLGVLVVDRNVLEWRLDATDLVGGYRGWLTGIPSG